VRYANEIGKIDVSAVSVSAKLQNAWSISVLPPAASSTRMRPRATRDGFWGLGAKGAFSRNLALTVEYQFYDLKREDYPVNGSLEPASTGILIGVQYTL